MEENMALYDRDYAKEQQRGVAQELGARSDLSAFIRKTYQLFAASLLAGSVGAYIGLYFAAQMIQNMWLFIGVVAAELILLVALLVLKRKEGLNYALLFAFTFMSGFTIAPMIAIYLSQIGAGIVTNAFILTTVAFGSLSVFAMNTKKDFTSMGKFLLISLVVLFVALIIGMSTRSSLVHLIISAAGAILFSIYVLYDTQNIIKGAYETPIEGAIALYLDFVNLFLFILRLLGIFSSDD
jgi:modulator of FtsH protease